mgnify:FL=1
MNYMLKVTRFDAHPKAGQELPRNYDGWNSGPPSRYPETVEVDVLVMAVDEAQYSAIRNAALEAAK